MKSCIPPAENRKFEEKKNSWLRFIIVNWKTTHWKLNNKHISYHSIHTNMHHLWYHLGMSHYNLVQFSWQDDYLNMFRQEIGIAHHLALDYFHNNRDAFYNIKKLYKFKNIKFSNTYVYIYVFIFLKSKNLLRGIIIWITCNNSTTMQICRKHKRIFFDPFHCGNCFGLATPCFVTQYHGIESIIKSIGKIAIQINASGICST